MFSKKNYYHTPTPCFLRAISKIYISIISSISSYRAAWSGPAGVDMDMDMDKLVSQVYLCILVIQCNTECHSVAYCVTVCLTVLQCIPVLQCVT